MIDNRKERILDLLTMHGQVQFKELAKHLDVSEETIRRDIKRLASDGEVVPVRGGAAMIDILRQAAFHTCLLQEYEAKRAIAIEAAKLVESGDSLIITGGGTTVYLAYELRSHTNLTVVTNSADIARLMVARQNNVVFTVGGILDPVSGSSLGPSAVESLKRYSADKCFSSPAFLSEKLGFMHLSHEEVEFAQTAMSCSEQTVMLCDHTKMSQRGTLRLCNFSDVETTVTDTKPKPEMLEAFKAAGSKLIIADEDPAD